MTEKQHKDWLEAMANIEGLPPLSPEKVNENLKKYISDKVKIFTDTGLTLSGFGLCTIEEKAAMVATEIRATTVLEELSQERMVKLLELILSELKNEKGEENNVIN